MVLAVVLNGFLWLGVLLVLCLVVMLVTPLKVELYLSTALSPRWRLTAQAFGGYSPKIYLFSADRLHKKGSSAKPHSNDAPPKTPSKKSASTHYLRHGPRLVVDLLRHVHLERLCVNADVGLSDPAATGELFGIVSALQYGLPPADHYALNIRPDFDTERIDGELLTTIQATPVYLLIPLVKFAWHSVNTRYR